MSTDRGPEEVDDGPGADARLATRAAAGDEAAFEGLVRRFRDRVFRLAHRFFPRPEDADDVAQEVFLNVHRALPSWRAHAPLEHWILRIATNACRDELRKRGRRPTRSLSAMDGDPAGWLDRALAGASMDAARAEEARRAAAALLDTLPPADRIVLVLLDLEGYSTQEVAAATGSTRGAVKIRAFRARRALRNLAGGRRGGRS